MGNKTPDQAAVKALAQRLIDAVYDDERGEGCDISAGLFGPKTSDLVRELAALAAPVEQAAAPELTDERIIEIARDIATVSNSSGVYLVNAQLLAFARALPPQPAAQPAHKDAELVELCKEMVKLHADRQTVLMVHMEEMERILQGMDKGAEPKESTA